MASKFSGTVIAAPLARNLVIDYEDNTVLLNRPATSAAPTFGYVKRHCSEPQVDRLSVEDLPNFASVMPSECSFSLSGT
jgi:hypothetical protein